MITKKQKLLAIVLTFFMIFGSMSLTACSLFGPSENDIEIISQDLVYDQYGRLIFAVKITNTSSQTVKVSFYGKIYLNDEIIEEGYSNVSTLASGETTTLEGPTIANPRYNKNSYSCKITKWNFY